MMVRTDLHVASLNIGWYHHGMYRNQCFAVWLRRYVYHESIGMWGEVLSAGEMLGLSRNEMNAIVE